MIRAGVIGYPISHSKSPIIHGHWMEKYTINGDYKAIDIAPEALASGVRDMIRDGYAGFNVTAPHKVAVMDLCDNIDDTARAIGAVNTVVIEDGKLYGRNTDVFGFVENLKTSLPDYAFDRPAMMLGAGGAARAAIYGLLQQGVPHIAICNRSKDKANLLREMEPQKISVIEWDARDRLAGYGLLVNTTSLGMSSRPPLEIQIHNLPADAAVYDIVYAPLMTDLLSAAQARGNHIITGIGMLLHQARPAFCAWTGVMPDIDDAIIEKVLA